MREYMRYDALTDEEKRAYDRHLDAVLYQRSVIETGRDEGLEKGLKKGLEEGLEERLKQGRKEGREEGREEGDRRARISIAQTMKKSGLLPQQIADMTSLPLEEILSL